MSVSIDTTDLGVVGEQLAVDYLQSRGYDILKRNYRSKLGEIDVIAQHDDTLCFVEVKMRGSEDQGHPLESITPNKQRKLSLTALAYMQEYGWIDSAARFDVVAIYQEGRGFKLDLLMNAFDSVY